MTCRGWQSKEGLLMLILKTGLFIFKIIGRIILIPLWLILLLIGTAADILINLASIVKGWIGFVLTVLMIAVIVVNRDWVQGLFLLCLNSVLFIILFFGVLIGEIIKELRDRVGLIVMGVKR